MNDRSRVLIPVFRHFSHSSFREYSPGDLKHRPINQISTTGALLSPQQTTPPGHTRMRFTVQYQNPTGHWVVYDNQSFTMLGSFRTEDDARVAARRFEERAPKRRATMTETRVA
jgi:hypothetical protein